MELPKGVQRVVTRGREYFYFQAGRGTTAPGPRTGLPNDTSSPAFWVALREAQGLISANTGTIDAVIDAYEVSREFQSLAPSSRETYRYHLRVARQAWGTLPAEQLRPAHVKAMVNILAPQVGRANGFVGVMRALSAWGRAEDHFPQSITEGVKPFKAEGGHKPWTDAQIEASKLLPPMLRRAVVLGIYTGQRGSDLVRLGWSDIDEGGFTIRQRKTGVEAWCPIVPELAAEMAGWEKQPGPFLRDTDNRIMNVKLLERRWRDARAGIPALATATLHGLRSTAVIRLRRKGLSIAQITDMIGMSMQMIVRYSRFADKKISGEAALIQLGQERGARNG